MAFTNIENTAKVVFHDTFDGRGFTDQNSLVNALLTKPDQLDPVLTHLMGRQDKVKVTKEVRVFKMFNTHTM